MVRHPAKFPDLILNAIRYYWPEWASGPILDPFAGTGRVHELADRLGLYSVGVEIEPEWAALHPRTIVGDALALPFPRESIGAVVTSPCYGNRMADHFDARDGSRRHTYRAYLGRPLSDRSAGKLQWGDGYRAFHIAAWREVHRVLRPGGLFVLNVSDHIRNGEHQYVTKWHVTTVKSLGFIDFFQCLVVTRRYGYGANRRLRIPYEEVVFFRKG